MNRKLPNFKLVKKCRGIIDQITNIHWIIERAREFQRNIYFYFTDYAKAFDCVDQKIYEKFLKSWGNKTTLPASCEICMQLKKLQLEQHMKNRMVPNWKRSTSRLYIATLLI